MTAERGVEDAPRSPVWGKLATTSDRLTTRSVELFVGGMSQRDMEAAWEKSLGQFVLSQSTMRTMTDTRGQEYEAFRTRDL